jgi:CubicO group peptidase (beta-lactamase class C family)
MRTCSPPDRLSRRRAFLPAIVACLISVTFHPDTAAATVYCDASGMAAQGFDPGRLCAVLDDFQADGAGFHGLLVMRRGAVVAERYRAGQDRSVYSLFAHTVDFGPTVRHDMRSISKSVTGLLWGIAAAQGKAPPLDTPVLDFFPALAGLRADGRGAITFAHLLSMTSGLSWNETGNYTLGNDELALYWRTSQPRYVLERPLVHPAGTRFGYNGGATAILADVLARQVGMPLPEYARQYLFAPLGIVDWEWLRDVRGRPLAFSGLRMRPRDLAKIGRLMLQHGAWNGRQVVPAAWIDACLRPRADVGDGRRYGYQWWLGKTKVRGRDEDWAGAFGNGGQRLFVVPALDLIVVVTAGFYDDEEGAIRVNRLFHRIAATADR